MYKQMCTHDEASLRRRSRSQSRAARSKRGIFSSQKGLDSLSRRNREKRQSLSQVTLTNTYLYIDIHIYRKADKLLLCKEAFFNVYLRAS